MAKESPHLKKSKIGWLTTLNDPSFGAEPYYLHARIVDRAKHYDIVMTQDEFWRMQERALRSVVPAEKPAGRGAFFAGLIMGMIIGILVLVGAIWIYDVRTSQPDSNKVVGQTNAHLKVRLLDEWEPKVTYIDDEPDLSTFPAANESPKMNIHVTIERESPWPAPVESIPIVDPSPIDGYIKRQLLWDLTQRVLDYPYDGRQRDY